MAKEKKKVVTVTTTNITTETTINTKPTKMIYGVIIAVCLHH